MKRIFLPKNNTEEASIIPGIDIIEIESLKDAVDILTNEKPPKKIETLDISTLPRNNHTIDFSSIHGQEQAKRALLIAACGGHNILMQ